MKLTSYSEGKLLSLGFSKFCCKVWAVIVSASEFDFGQYPLLLLLFSKFDVVMLLEAQGEFSKFDVQPVSSSSRALCFPALLDG